MYTQEMKDKINERIKIVYEYFGDANGLRHIDCAIYIDYYEERFGSDALDALFRYIEFAKDDKKAALETLSHDFFGMRYNESECFTPRTLNY